MAESKDMLSIDEVTEVMKFANQIYRNDLFGYYTPYMSNSNLINLNNNPMKPTEQKVSDALSTYKDSEELLQSYSEFMDTYDMIYSRLVEYYTNMLAFNLDTPCLNAYNPKVDYASKEFKQDKRRFNKFLKNFDYKYEFSNVLKEIVRHEIDYVWLRDSQGTINNEPIELEEDKPKKGKKRTNVSKYTLQILPQTYCITTGKWENGLLFDFDMNYFLRGGVNINSFDPIFKKYWNEVFDEKGNPKYNPTSSLNKRDGSFALMVQTSPEDGAYCFKLDISNTSNVPFLSPMIKQCLSNEEVEKLQKSKNMISAHAILAGGIQVNQKQQSGAVNDTMAYNMTSLIKLLKLVKEGLSDGINAVAMPTADPKMYQYSDSNKEMASTQLKNSVGQGASASRMIFANDKMSESEIQNAIYTDYLIISKVYRQFGKFLEFYGNKKTKKYKFSCIFSGSEYPFIKEIEKKNLMDLSDRGINLPPRAYAKIVNMTPYDFENYLEEGKYSGWIDGEENLLTQMLSIHTQSGASGEVGQGAPKKDNTEISDNGATSRDY